MPGPAIEQVCSALYNEKENILLMEVIAARFFAVYFLRARPSLRILEKATLFCLPSLCAELVAENRWALRPLVVLK